MKQELTKKILLTIGLAILIGLGIWLLCAKAYETRILLKWCFETPEFFKEFYMYFVWYLFYIINVFIYGFLICKIWIKRKNYK